MKCATFNKDSTTIASGASSGEILLFGLLESNGRPARLERDGPAHAVNGLQYSPFVKNLLAAVYDNGDVVVWDATTTLPEAVFEAAHTKAATAVGFSPYNRLLLCTAGLDGILLFYDIEAKRCRTSDISTLPPLLKYHSLQLFQDNQIN